MEFELANGIPLQPDGKSDAATPGLLQFHSDGPVTAWDTYFHDANDPLGLGGSPLSQIWDVQSVGGTMTQFGEQVPEPATALMSMAGVILLLRRRQRSS